MIRVLVVAGAVEDLDGVGEEVGDGFEGLDRAFGAAGEIDDEGFGADGGDGAGEDGGGSLFCAFAAHFFGNAGDEAVGYGDGGFGSVVARADAGAAGGEEQIDAAGVGDVCEVVRGWRRDRRGGGGWW